MTVLLEAFQYAEQTSGDRWDFAVEVSQLTALGLSRNDFRWLIHNRLVEHQREVTLEGDDGRVFRPEGRSTFTDGTCFILTDEGVSVAHELSQSEEPGVSCCSSAITSPNDSTDSAPGNLNPSTDEPPPALRPCVPKWDPERRELRFAGATVKRFKWHAVNQERILAAFEEEGWPRRIDDSLCPKPGQDSKRRLGDTIKWLNRKQHKQLIHFRGDGTGEGVIWELVDQNASPESLDRLE